MPISQKRYESCLHNAVLCAFLCRGQNQIHNVRHHSGAMPATWLYCHLVLVGIQCQLPCESPQPLAMAFCFTGDLGKGHSASPRSQLLLVEPLGSAWRCTELCNCPGLASPQLYTSAQAPNTESLCSAKNFLCQRNYFFVHITTF